MKKIVTVVGARPQFIKAAAVSRELRKYSDINEIIVHTGQHYDASMSEVFFDQMSIPQPQYNLGVGGGGHGKMTGRQLEKIEEILVEEMPDYVLVYGDTNSTLAGALAAAKLHIPVAHVEAGLRSYNRRMPEEVNRVLTDHISSLLFVPTAHAAENLRKEGIIGNNVIKVGDVMLDVTLFYKERAIKPIWFDGLNIDEFSYILCTIHRAENTDDISRLNGIFDGLRDGGLPVVLPIHPRTQNVIKEWKLAVPNNVHIVPPAGYFEMLWLQAHCNKVATDSGGVQKEAYFHGKYCITLRDETEWVELVENGLNELVGADAARIAKAIASNPQRTFVPGLYGNGNAAHHIVEALK